MYGADRRGFDWKEVAKVLRMTRAAVRLTFWREIKRSRSKSIEAQAPAIVSRDETDSDTLKLGKARASR
jgi:hypothetical protein